LPESLLQNGTHERGVARWLLFAINLPENGTKFRMATEDTA
jgi:hypothetical protein